MLEDGKILIGKSAKPEYLTLRLANRHGLVTGATGTGKTVTLQVLAEGFSNAGVPVFAADIKGDLSGIAAAGRRQAALRQARAGDRPRIHAGPLSRWCSGTCSASRAIRSAPPSARWGRCCSPACSSSTTCRRACSTSPSGSPTRPTCRCSTSRTCARCSTSSSRTPTTVSAKYGNVAKASVGADPAPAARAREPGRRQVLRRAGARTCRTS